MNSQLNIVVFLGPFSDLFLCVANKCDLVGQIYHTFSMGFIDSICSNGTISNGGQPISNPYFTHCKYINRRESVEIHPERSGFQ